MHTSRKGVPTLSSTAKKLNAEHLKQAQKLEQRIRAAFADTSQPDPDNIGVRGTWYDKEGLEHHYDNLETIRVGQLFGNKHWKELAGEPLEKVYASYSALGMMTPEAKVFFLPAYMITSIYCFYGDTDVPDAPIFALIHPEILHHDMHARTQLQTDALKRDYLDKFNAFISLLTIPQKRVIRAYLDFIQNTYPRERDRLIDEAMQGYWSQVDPN